MYFSKILVALSLIVTIACSPDAPASQVAAQTSDRATGIALLQRATEHHANRQYAEAVALYDSALVHLPQITDWISVFAAASLAQKGDTAGVERRMGNVDDTLAGQWGWRARVRAYEKAGLPTRAIELATSATTSGTASKRAEAWYRIAELQRDSQDPTAQRAGLLNAIREAPGSDPARDAALEIAAMTDLSSTEQILVARTLMRTGDLVRGTRLMESALKIAPEADRAQIRFELGRVLFGAGKYADASRHLRAVTGKNALAADARYLLARSIYRQSRVPEGKRVLQSVVTDFRATSAATRALFLLGDLAHDDGKLDEAVRFFERAAAAPAKTDETALALMRLGDIAFVRGNYVAAAAIFKSFANRYPNGALNDQAIFWSAMSNIKAGQNAAANVQLQELRRSAPISYYAMRAAAIQGASPIENTKATVVADTENVRKGLEAGLDRWQLLREVGWDQAAGFELSRFRQRLADDRLALVTLAEELNARDAPHLGIAIGRELLAAGAPRDNRMLKIMYPMPYIGLIQRNATEHGLDPFFIAGVIRQESRFNPKAVSVAGAIGLMQVMPATGRQIQRNSDGAGAADRLSDPEVNIKLGSRFLADLSQIYGSRMDAILIAYNAGPTRADRWRRFPEFATEDLFIERIPFTETRDYVKAVKLNTAIYRALYASPKSAD